CTGALSGNWLYWYFYLW
nr:immunoglobulin heavy chain junction region [Macaca mulatta]MOW75196.1 immunoglobulin heavy chain junction region [Macaca mulatta]MOW75312.1 immunoglobulin heavy chain junction region [Macaca mulatta]MOW75318.1 immunoglobulin heavy chain junction region [Macaca mulatta]MOW75405.1 immunoglobulin heavy chain junction region [Macaca mulatta]